MSAWGLSMLGNSLKLLKQFHPAKRRCHHGNFAGCVVQKDLTSKQDAILFVVSMTLIFSVPIGLSLFSIIGRLLGAP